MTSSLVTIQAVLAGLGSRAAFSAQRRAPVSALEMTVEGVGHIGLPISKEQGRALCEVADLAHYGQGEETLLDREVRDTWVIPTDRVRFERGTWDEVLQPLVDELREELGVLGTLRTKFHSMLVYGPGQFFRPHQDSETADEMLGTLVVTLPSSFRGGSFVVEHAGETATYRGSERDLSLVAFYSDCRHEVRPVEEGYRVVLTYDLLLDRPERDPARAVEAPMPRSVIDKLSDELCLYFETPRPPRRYLQDDDPPDELPTRLILLLDHEYTERGLSWDRLKGADAPRVEALRAAAEEIDCEMVLGLVEVRETWGCIEPGWDRRSYGRRRSWQWDDGWDEVDSIHTDPDGFELTELHDDELTLDRWLQPDGAVEKVSSWVRRGEVCWIRPTAELQPYASEYEGFMGNYGNTMDRWYRRAAVVLWPKERAFSVRAEASPAWGLATMREAVRLGQVEDARDMAAAFSSFWGRAGANAAGETLFDNALSVAARLHDPQLSVDLLSPFSIVRLTPRHSSNWVGLFEFYGLEWVKGLLARWSDHRYSFQVSDSDAMRWMESLPALCHAVRSEGTRSASSAGELVLRDRWAWLRNRLEGARVSAPSRREAAAVQFAPPAAFLLESVAIVEEEDLLQELLGYLRQTGDSMILSCSVQILQLVDLTDEIPDLDRLANHCAEQIESILAKPARDPNDWSIIPPSGCDCNLCQEMAEFLAERSVQRLEWPINKEKRRHIHGRIDSHELPVQHVTRRSGSPYTLVLTKTQELFERERRQREEWRRNLRQLRR
ncbi:MAG: 2OG-Fe(II) oxygenase [Thermoanaerobaculia bacterium]|nr:2OG-Fe(II) oxygenase [Thermoanaerobaculia bacterium]